MRWKAAVRAVALTGTVLVVGTLASAPQAYAVTVATVGLGSAETFSISAGDYVAMDSLSSVSGDVGASNYISLAGGAVGGSQHLDDLASRQAHSDLTVAYSDAEGRTPTAGNLSGDLAGLSLTAGVYHSDAAFTMAASTTLTLDGLNDPNAVFILQTPSYLSAGASASVRLVNGAQASHVFWQTGTYVSLGAGAQFVGTIFARTYVSFGAGDSLSGRAYALGGYVSLDSTNITTPKAAPTAPTAVSAAAYNNGVMVSWAAPISNGASPITGYTITPSPTCSQCGGLTSQGQALSSTVTGLTKDQAYTFTVTATNNAGTSTPSFASNSVTPTTGAPATTVPGTPTIGTTVAGDTSVLVSWSPPTSNGGSPITGYTITPSPTCAKCGLISLGQSLSSMVTGLTNGKPYTFTVTATNAVGPSAPSSASPSVTPLTAAPGAPTAVVAAAGDTGVLVSWSPPTSTGGSPIASYTITPNPVCAGCGGLTSQGQALSSTVTGLTSGQSYTFTVTATNAAGPSAPSSASNSATPLTTVPGAPTAVTAAAGNMGVVVSWTAPTSTGGSPIASYTITPNPACPGCAGLTTTDVSSKVTGLANGQPYTFTVTATNGAPATSLPSAPSNSVTSSTAGFTSVSPTRVLDTRSGLGAARAKVGAGQTLTLAVPNLPAGTTAVALNFTVTNPTDESYLTVYPGNGPRPTASDLNFGAGQTIANMILVPVGPGSTVTFYNNLGTVDVVADLLGYYAPNSGAGFTGTTPKRVLDTRNSIGLSQGKVGAGQTMTLTIPGLPTGTTAVALNVTATNATDGSYLTVYPGTGSRPTASSLNYGQRQTVANIVLVPVGPGSTVTFYNNLGSVDVVADLLGYYAPNSGAGFTGTTPTRVMDTRANIGTSQGKVGAGQTMTLTIPGLPTGTTAVALNVTAANPTDGSYLTVYPGTGSRPTASSLNFGPGQTIPNMVLVPVGPGNTVTFYNNLGAVDVVADLLGYFSS